ncbi:hypothetical protein KI387_021671 [Taxus chinensis]|uniref:Uncharacterized protein n=1 Tax=Taxus chinensis TaxID=29808 RepID=A0AA38GAN3_TAXCH|nr:hypothetical protein KI387_021671 [Taxus chinensis]
MQEQHQRHNQSGVDASNMIMSNFSQADVNAYGSCSAAGFELPSNTTTTSLDMGSLRSDNGSLYLFEALNRTHNAEWHQKRLSSQSEVMKSEAIMNANNNDQKRPKLEDFLGGAFVGVQFSDDAETHHIHTSELDQIYGKAPAPAFSRDSDHSSAMNTSIVGDHMHVNGFSDLTSDSSKHSQYQSDQAHASTAMQDIYNNNGDQAYNMFSDCSLQLSQSSVNNNNNMHELSDFSLICMIKMHIKLEALTY